MATRIKYLKTSVKGVIKSKPLTSSKGTELVSIVDYNKNEYRIIRVKDNRVMRRGGANNMNVLRRLARKAMISCGVVLYKEFKDSEKLKRVAKDIHKMSLKKITI